MHATLLDRLIARVSPAAALRRMHARDQFEAFSAPGGDGGGMSPLNTRWSTSPRSADADQLRALPRQRAESRELRRTNPIAGGAIATNLNRVVGTGLVPIPEPDQQVLGWTDDQTSAFKAAVIREFSLWADSPLCDWYGTETFFQWQASVLGARLESGDCATLLPDADPTPAMPYRLRLQLIEADRIGNPGRAQDTDTIIAGIRRSPQGAPAAAFVYDRHPGATHLGFSGSTGAGTWYTYTGPSGRRRVLHHFRPTRPEQTRGVPYLAPVIQAIKDLGRYTEAEISAAVIAAFYTVFVTSEKGPTSAPIHGMPTTQGAAESSPGPEMAMAPAAVIGLAAGEKIEIADPNRPNTAYEPFVTGILTLIGAGLGLPVELLIKKFNASYSASKAALLDAWQHFRSERAWLVVSACQPAYETLLAEMAASGRVAMPGFFESALHRWAYTRAAWHGDSPGSINPKDEVAAYRSAIDARLMTLERAEWELWGTDWHRSFPAKVREIQMMRTAGIDPAPAAGAAAARPEPTEATQP